MTSNPGHALWAGLLRGKDARPTVDRLLASDMLCGWGLRTLSRTARTFNPMSYHNGSVWPHDNALIALGMRRAGADIAARVVASEVFEAGLRFPGARLPELWCGFDRDRRYRSTPAQYPVSCSPQAWAAGAFLLITQAMLGLKPEAPEKRLRIVDPKLPYWLNSVNVRGLRVGAGEVSLNYRRDGNLTRVEIEEATGGIDVFISKHWPV